MIDCEMKKFMKSVLGLSMIWFVWISFCLWVFWNPDESNDSSFPYQKNPSASQNCDDTTNLWDCVDIKDDKSIVNGLLEVFNLDRVSEGSDHKFLNYVKAILNVALGLLSMVALIMTIYTFYLMFFTENEAWIKKAKWNLVGIFIALAIIWLAWLIVSFIFRWYQAQWKENEPNITQQNITMVNYELDNQIYLNV